MAASQGHPVLRLLRRITASNNVGETPDAQLLAHFVAHRDEAAFAGLVGRHGPMVFGVCRRVLGDTPDAEDAFQAAFLVLARRAASVSRPELLGNWLYGVAYRTARKARADAANRRARERQVRAVGAADPADEVARRDLRRALDDELHRLPDHYRAPLVLCYLEGHTQEEAARRLGCPRKTITTRLARACERLRGRLVRRGLALPAGVLAAVLTAEVAPAAAPTVLVSATIKAAVLFAAGEAAASGVVPARVAALAKEVSKAMFVTKLKSWMAVLLAAAVVGAAAGLFAYLPVAAEPPEGKKDGPPQPAGQRADPAKEPARKTDQDKIQGAWALVAAEVEGKKASEEEVKKIAMKLNFAGDKVMFEQDGASQASTFRLDPAREPKEIDLILDKPEVHKGIYRLEGDTLTVCMSHPPEERPAAFATNEGSKWPMLLVFKRTGEADQARLQGSWTATGSEVDGKPADNRKGTKFVFAGDRITVQQDGQENEEIAFTLDPFATPRAVDLVAQAGKQKGMTLLGIYSLEGDTLKLCLSWDERRPIEFAAPPGRKMQLIVFKRDK